MHPPTVYPCDPVGEGQGALLQDSEGLYYYYYYSEEKSNGSMYQNMKLGHKCAPSKHGLIRLLLYAFLFILRLIRLRLVFALAPKSCQNRCGACMRSNLIRFCHSGHGFRQGHVSAIAAAPFSERRSSYPDVTG